MKHVFPIVLVNIGNFMDSSKQQHWLLVNRGNVNDSKSNLKTEVRGPVPSVPVMLEDMTITNVA